MNALVKNSSRHYGARCREYKIQQIYSEDIGGNMIFDRSRLFFRSILPQTGTTTINVHVLQDITDMPWTLGYTYTDDDALIAAYHAKYGPYTVDVFEEKFDRLFLALARCGSDLTCQFRKLNIIKNIYAISCESIFLVKEYSEQLLMLLYEDAFKYCELFNEDYLGTKKNDLESGLSARTQQRAETYKAETVSQIREFIEKADVFFTERPYLVFRMKASLLDRFLEKKSYRHLRYGLEQFWIDPLRARILAKHHDLYFRDFWFRWMSRHFHLPECIYLHIIEWLLFTKTNKFVGESMLSLLQRTHDIFLGATDIEMATKFKRITRDVNACNGEFLDIINVEIFI